MDVHDTTQAICNATGLGDADAKAIVTTVDLLCRMAGQPLKFSASHLTLLDDNKGYFYQLALKAHLLAMANGCSSILAGQGSESDDTGDVGFYLGEGDYEKAENVLKTLGLPENGVSMPVMGNSV